MQDDTEWIFRDASIPCVYGDLPVVSRLDSVLSEAECDDMFYTILSRYRDRQLHRVYAQNGVDSHVDTSSRYTHSYPTEILRNRIEVIDAVQASIQKLVSSRFPGRMVSASVRPQILGYEERCLFRTHCDNSILVGGSWVRNDPLRDLTGILYLSDSVDRVTRPNQYAGGNLVFPNIVDANGTAMEIKPKKGTLLMFPSSPRYQHQVRVIHSGYRLAMVDWWALI